MQSVWWWSAAAWIAAGATLALWSYRLPPRPANWRLRSALIVIAWPLVFGAEIWARASAAADRRGFGFRDLIPIGSWPGSLLAVCAGLAASFLLLGFWWPYWRIADMDLFMVYEAFLYNDGLAPEFHDHPANLTVLLLGGWFRALHAAGLLDVHSLAEVPPPASAAHAWMAAVQAGRLLSLAVAGIFVIAFGALVRALVRDWRTAVLATFALAFSGGLTTHARVIRPELLCAAFMTCGLLILLLAARATRTRYRPLLVGFAAFLVALSQINKVQMIFLVCALPLLVLPFGQRSERPAEGLRWDEIAIMILAAALAAAAAPLLSLGLSQPLPMPWIVGGLNLSGLYQLAIATWIVVTMAVFAVVWRVSAAETIAALASVLAGISAALLLLYIRHDTQEIAVVCNPVEQLLLAAASGGEELNVFAQIVKGFAIVARTRTFVLDSSVRPTIFLEWLSIVGAVVAWRSGKRMLALQAALLIGAGWVLDVLYAARGLKLQYFILTDPLIIIAAALLVAELEVFRTHRRVFQVGIALFVLHVAISQSLPISLTFAKSRPQWLCVEHFAYTKRIETFPFCADQGS